VGFASSVGGVGAQVIVDLVLGLLESVLSFVGSLLPDMGALPWGTVLDDVEDFSSGLGFAMGPLDQFVPLSEVFACLTFMLGVYLPLVGTYLTVRWIYEHLPWIGRG